MKQHPGQCLICAAFIYSINIGGGGTYCVSAAILGTRDIVLNKTKSLTSQRLHSSNETEDTQVKNSITDGGKLYGEK